MHTYERREPGLKKIFFRPAEAMSAGIGGWHTQVRSVIKARRAVENRTVPLMSVLEYHVHAEMWINPERDKDPLQHGWELCEEKISEAEGMEVDDNESNDGETEESDLEESENESDWEDYNEDDDILPVNIGD